MNTVIYTAIAVALLLGAYAFATSKPRDMISPLGSTVIALILGGVIGTVIGVVVLGLQTLAGAG